MIFERSVTCLATKALVVALTFFAVPIQAETWKVGGTRASDGAPFYLDMDYLAEYGPLIEFRFKIKAEKNILTLLLPDGEVEDRYVVDCAANKVGLIFRKTTRGGNSTIDLDALPAAVMLIDVPAGTMLAPSTKWACDEFKKKVAARQSPPPVTRPAAAKDEISKRFIGDDAIGRYKWKLTAASVVGDSKDEVYDAYAADDSITEINKDKGIWGFVSRWDYRPKTADKGVVSRTVLGYWAIGCNTRKVVMLERHKLDRYGSILERLTYDEKNPAIYDVEDGTVGGSYFDYICVASTAKSTPKQNDPKATTPNLSFGTAWLSDRGYFVTAYHVVEGANEIAIRSIDGKVSSARVVASDKPNDVAILLSSASAGVSGLPVAKGVPGLGARVFTIGYPHPDLMGVSQKLTSGDVSSLSGLGDDPRLLQISTPIQAGNSGGPLIGLNGEVVGLISAKLSAAQVLSKTGDLPQNVNYAVKGRYIAGLLEDLAPQSTQLATRAGKQQTLEDAAANAKRAIFLIVAQ